MDVNSSPANSQLSNQDDDEISIIRYRSGIPAPRAMITLPRNLITFLLDGEKTVHFAGAQVNVKPHQFVMLAAGNCLMSEKIASLGVGYHSILIFFNNKFLSDFFDRYASLINGHAKTSDQHPFLLFEKDEFLINFTRSLDCMLIGDKPVHPQLQKIKLDELLVYLAVQFPGQVQRIRNMHYEANDDRLIREAVTSHITNSITVEELAFLCNMSLSTFKRRFGRLYGNSPNRWLLEKRMERAAEMLRRNDRKASEIYSELGYENLSSFIQSFKQIYGVTPKQYQLSI
ncbi:AraC family transcriptional regulator [Niastella koreensis]|uniref:Transcriptional regulator, AraC family n=2 Tax=Niastella koreensis TaxID=354356 RepID=G8TRH8_NIAKG|nr:AraC family transcriptional regulator [Niastella koreensis]AEW01109.1 transcriptional regulator, AraC family [Niastella koreensis GR20-10]OQP41827.1 AraC family transcriptional regulator [Niastella koreensis]